MVVPSSLTNTERLKNGNAELGCLLKIKENKEIKVKKNISRKSQPNF